MATDAQLRKIFAKNVRRLIDRSQKTQKQIAKECGLTVQTVNNWYQGVSMPRTVSVLDKFAEYMNCTRADLLEEPNKKQMVVAIKIPVYGRIAAGIPLEMIEDITDYEELDPAKFDQNADYFAMKIHGNSMEPKMSENDVVIARKQYDAESGEICIISVNRHDATCKKIRKHHDGIELIPLNPACEPIYYSAKQVETMPVRIIGKVVELRAKL